MSKRIWCRTSRINSADLFDRLTRILTTKRSNLCWLQNVRLASSICSQQASPASVPTVHLSLICRRTLLEVSSSSVQHSDSKRIPWATWVLTIAQQPHWASAWLSCEMSKILRINDEAPCPIVWLDHPCRQSQCHLALLRISERIHLKFYKAAAIIVVQLLTTLVRTHLVVAIPCTARLSNWANR